MYSTHSISVVDVDGESKSTWTERLVGNEAVFKRCFSLWLDCLLVCQCCKLPANMYKTINDYTHTINCWYRKLIANIQLLMCIVCHVTLASWMKSHQSSVVGAKHHWAWSACSCDNEYTPVINWQSVVTKSTHLSLTDKHSSLRRTLQLSCDMRQCLSWECCHLARSKPGC